MAWWSDGPHVEKDGRRYYVHAMGCLRSDLGRAIREHPDWYLIAAVVRGRNVQLHGLDDDDALALADVGEMREALSPDEMLAAIEFSAAEMRRRWGVSFPDRGGGSEG